MKVCWGEEFVGDHCIGIGVFADEDIEAGTVLRIGTIGVNLVIFNPTTNYPNKNKTKATAEHLKNYAWVCPCHVKGGGKDMMVLIPGSGINHRTQANSMTVCRKDGVDLVAVRPIKRGEPISNDYNLFGRAPQWHVDMLKEAFGTDECVFRGLNDYVTDECVSSQGKGHI